MNLKYLMASSRTVRRLTSRTIKQALGAFIIPLITQMYDVISVRTLWDAKPRDDGVAEELIAVKRRQLELLLREKEVIQIMWTCVTGIEEKKKVQKKKTTDNNTDSGASAGEETTTESDIKPGVSFWLVVYVPEEGLNTVRAQIIQVILSSGLDIAACKPIAARGIYFHSIFLFFRS